MTTEQPATETAELQAKGETMDLLERLAREGFTVEIAAVGSEIDVTISRGERSTRAIYPDLTTALREALASIARGLSTQT